MKHLLSVTKKVLPIIITVVLLQMGNVSETTAAPPASGGSRYHTVKYGETLYKIGRYYGVNPYQIARANSLRNPNYIYAGQVLYIPSGQKYNQYSNYRQFPKHDNNRYSNYDNYNSRYSNFNYHTVARGETLTSIAYRYGTSPWAIAKANRIYDLNRIYVGQVLFIPSSGYHSY